MRIITLLFLPLFVYAGSLSVEVSAPYGCVMNADTGAVLYQKNMDCKLFPGSVTKIATALYILEECSFDMAQKVTSMPEALLVTTEKKKVESNFSLAPYLQEKDGTTLYLQRGEQLTIKHLLYGLMLRSANDAANVLAMTFAPSVEEFMFQMNVYLRKIGCKNTHFNNPHGLHHPDHYTSAHDLAIIMYRSMAHPFLRKLLSTHSYVIPKTNLSPKRELISKNKLIDQASRYFLPSVQGGKTGYHRRAKRNIVAFGERDGRSIIAVVNKAETREHLFDDCRKLFNAAFEEKKTQRTLFNASESKFFKEFSWASGKLSASLKEDVVLSYFPSEERDLKVEIHWQEKENAITPGEVVATLDVYDSLGSPIHQAELFADHALSYKFVFLVEQFLNGTIKIVASYPKTVLLIVVGLFLFLRRRKIKTV